MAYQTNPVFSPGNVLAASELNILTANLDFLHTLLGNANPSFTQLPITSAGISGALFNQLHRAQYFHWKISITSGQHDNLSIRYNGTTIFSDGGARSAPYTWQGPAVDLNVSPGGLTLGNFYDVEIDFAWQSGNAGVGSVIFLGETNSQSNPI